MGRPSVREKIVVAAVETLHKQGFNGCSIQDITDAAGVPKGSFFNHFKSKELLALEVLNRYGEQNHPELLFDLSKSPLMRLRQHFEFMASRYEEWSYERSCLLADFGAELSASHPQMRAAVKGVFSAWSEAVASVLLDAQTEKEIDSRLDTNQTARFIVSAWEGTMIRAKVDKDKAPIEDFFALCFDCILK